MPGVRLFRGVTRSFPAGVHFFFASKVDDFFSHRRIALNIQGKPLNSSLPPSPSIKNRLRN